MDGRSGSSSMRLNFAGVPEQDIREGIRRIGRGVAQPARPARHAHRLAPATAPAEPRAGRRARPATPPQQLADVVALPAARRARRRAPLAATDERPPAGGGAQGGPLARAQRLAALRRPGPGRAQRPRPRGGRDRRGPKLVPRPARARSRTPRSSPCTAATARTGPSRGCSRRSAIPYTGSGPGGLHARHRQGARQAADARGRDPHAGRSQTLREESIKELGAAAALERIETRTRLAAGRQAGPRGLGAGGQVRRAERRAADSDGRGVLL